MRTTIFGGVAALALAAVAGVATAQTPSQPARGEPVTRAQFVDARVARLTALDADRDGVVSVEERRAGGEARRAERAAARFARLDANSDGAVTRAEFDAAHEARPERAGRRGGARHAMRGPGRERGPTTIAEAAAKLGERFDKADANRDGVISADERRAAMTAHRAERQARRAERRAARPAQQPASPAPASE